MNKVNWVDGRYTTPDDFNAMQTAPEDHLRSHAKAALAGHIDGLTPTGTADGVQVSPGVTWDDQGRRIMVPAATAVDMSAIQRPASGQYRWVSISIAYRQIERSTVRDSGGVDRPAYLDDSFTILATPGPEFADRSLVNARFISTGVPAIPNGSVGIGTFIVDHDSGWPDLVHVIHRRSYISSKAVTIVSNDLAEIRRLTSAILPARDTGASDRLRVYGWGAVDFTFTRGVSSPAGGAPVLYIFRADSIIIRVAMPVSRSAINGTLNLSLGSNAPTNICLRAVFFP